MGWEDGCLDAVAYESLISIVLLNNYLRLVRNPDVTYLLFSAKIFLNVLRMVIFNKNTFSFQVNQYKNVVFYGPIGASKTFLAKKLAKCVQVSLSVW